MNYSAVKTTIFVAKTAILLNPHSNFPFILNNHIHFYLKKTAFLVFYFEFSSIFYHIKVFYLYFCFQSVHYPLFLSLFLGFSCNFFKKIMLFLMILFMNTLSSLL